MQQQIVETPKAAKVVGVEAHHYRQIIHPPGGHQSLESQVLLQALSSFGKDLLGKEESMGSLLPPTQTSLSFVLNI